MMTRTPSALTTLAFILVAHSTMAAHSPIHAQSLSGCWMGTLGTGPGQVRGAFEFTRSGSDWGGMIHRMGRSLNSDALSMVSTDGASVSVTFPGTLGTDEAIFNATIEGDVLSGTIESGGQSLLTELTRTDPGAPDPALALLGYWSGGLFQGSMLALRMGVEFAPAPCGQVTVTMDSPDQATEDIPVSGVSVDGDSVSLDVARIAGSFRGTISSAGDSIQGAWSQSGVELTLRLARSDGPVSFARPQDPTPPFPYSEIEASYTNENDGTSFAGTLTVPEGEGPFPAVLLITGSGAQDRNESLMGHRPFLVIADHLTRLGIAVLRVDDRGVGGSTGNVMEATIEDNVGDALAAISFLQARPEVDPGRIGLIGHSEGGWVAPWVAAESDDVAFVVMLAGPAVTGREIMLAQNRAIMEASDSEMIEEQMTVLRVVLDIAAREADVERAMEAIRAGIDELVAAMAPDVRAAFAETVWTEVVQAQFEQNLQTMITPWYRYLVSYDPVRYLEAFEVPVLAVFGERDLQVPALQSVPILERVWRDHPDATIHVFPELNHLFQHAETGLMNEYALIEETFAPEALEMISEWIGERFQGR